MCLIYDKCINSHLFCNLLREAMISLLKKTLILFLEDMSRWLRDVILPLIARIHTLFKVAYCMYHQEKYNIILVINLFRFKSIVGIGVGAGAYILAKFAVSFGFLRCNIKMFRKGWKLIKQ